MNILPLKTEEQLKPKTLENKGDFGELKFVVISVFGELLDLAIKLSEKYETVFCILDSKYKDIGEGIVKKSENWHEYLFKDYIFVVDGTETADLQDWMREQGEYVVGTNKEMSDLENDRQKGQAWFEELGFIQPQSQNFTDFDSAIEHIKKGGKWIMKQNGTAPKSLNHKQHFESGEDMIHHLEQMKLKWNESEYGKVDFDLMEVVEGQEIAAMAFFNGHDWLRDREGKVVGNLNFEHKKEKDGDLGVTTGEMGTIFYGCDEDNELFADILLREGIEEKLRASNYRGEFDINGAITDNGFVAFEATSRFGVPESSYDFGEFIISDAGELLAAMAMGMNAPVSIRKGWGLVQVVVSKPFPVEEDLPNEATSVGEKLWIIRNGKSIKDFTDEQKKHIHLQNFKKEDGNYVVATKNGYLLTVTRTGNDIDELREETNEYIKENLYISNMSYRQDLGSTIEKRLLT